MAVMMFGSLLSLWPAAGAISGSVYAWGNEQLGPPTVPSAARQGVTGIAAGTAHLVALKVDGTVIEWGINDPEAVEVPGITNAVAVAAGRAHSVALLANGTVVAWGENFSGQTNVPAGLSGVVAISAAADHSVALRSDGSLAGWGDNLRGQLSFPTNLPAVVSVATGRTATVAILADGSTRWWKLVGEEFWTGEGPPDLRVVASSNGLHIGIKADGSLAVWSEYRDRIGMPPGLENLTAVAIGSDRLMAARSDGSVVQWRMIWWDHIDYEIIPNPVGLRDVMAVACGETYAVALIAPQKPRLVRQPVALTREHLQSAQFSVEVEETLLSYQWRFNGAPIRGATNATLDLPMVRVNAEQGLYDVIVSNPAGSVISESARLTILPAPSAIAVAWGGPNLPQPIVPDAARTDLQSVAAGHFGGISLKRDGRVVSWPEPAPADLHNVIAVAAGVSHWIALQSDGQVTAWGNGEHGQTNVPPDLSSVVAIAAGGFHCLALRDDGRVAAWGDDSAGQSTVPNGLTQVQAISAGYRHSVALRDDGTVVAWGSFGTASREVPAGLSDIRAIAAGGLHTLALRSNGTVMAWGNNFRHQTSIPAGLSKVVAVAAGFEFSLALLEDGTLVTWGSDEIGRPPVGLSNVSAIAAGADFTLALVDDSLSPRLRVELTSSGIRASWPPAAGVFSLQAREGLGHGQWEKVSGTPVLDAGRYTMELPANGSGQFFQLVRP